MLRKSCHQTETRLIKNLNKKTSHYKVFCKRIKLLYAIVANTILRYGKWWYTRTYIDCIRITYRNSTKKVLFNFATGSNTHNYCMSSYEIQKPIAFFIRNGFSCNSSKYFNWLEQRHSISNIDIKTFIKDMESLSKQASSSIDNCEHSWINLGTSSSNRTTTKSIWTSGTK